jgi:undecaprenyl-diphosphatase
MDQWINAVLLGLLEGITEFLPISSTGHLIVLGEMLHFEGNFSKLFDVVIQLGAILAVVWLYRHKFIHVVQTFTSEPNSRHFVINVLLAFAPAVIIGLIAHDFIKSVLFSSTVVGFAFIVGGVVIIIVERFAPRARFESTEAIPVLTALKIGFFQCLAMVPGTSRSGATIVGALLLGVTRTAATEFSFFLAIPTMAGATVLDLWKARHDIVSSEWGIIGVGFIVAFVSALLVVRGLIGFISRHGFTPFAIYRIVAGFAILGWVYHWY